MSDKKQKKQEVAVVAQEADEMVVAEGGYEDDAMVPAETVTFNPEDAGKGVSVDRRGMIMPRVSLLQAMSKPVQDELPGAKAGAYWLGLGRLAALLNRGPTGDVQECWFIPVMVVDDRTLWKPIDQGGGILCQAPNGKTAREANGRAGAKIKLTHNGTEALAVDWEGGTPTAHCAECVFGPGACAAVGSSASRNGEWLPKTIEYDSKTVKISDRMRAPRCTPGISVLGLFRIPADDQNAAEIMPAVFTFSNTSHKAGQQLVTQLAIRGREPAWARIWCVFSKKTTNAAGTFYVSNIRTVGATPGPLVERAKALYESVAEIGFHADYEEPSQENVEAAQAANAASPDADGDKADPTAHF